MLMWPGQVTGSLAKVVMENAVTTKEFQDLKKYLYMGTNGTTDVYNSYWGIIQNVYDFVKIIGFALIVTFFLKALLQEATKDNLTIEQLIKLMIGLILSVTIISNIPTLTNAFMKISETITSAIADPSMSNPDDADSSDEKVDEAIATAINTWSDDTYGPIALLQAIVCWFIHQIAIIAFDLSLITRAFDIGWKVAIAPIACADMFEGTNSPGVRHLKSLLGSTLVIVVLMIIARAGQAITTGLLASPLGGNIWMAVATQGAMAGASIGANNKAKEILG